MTREEFIKRSLVFGAGLPFLPVFLDSCTKKVIEDSEFEINFSGKVLIIGAGAAGLTAGYLLQRNNIDFEIIEASNSYGGRVKRINQFADFPIDLGAEWIHEKPSILSEILSDKQLNATIDLITYNPQTVYSWEDETLKKQNWASNYYSEYKFKSTTWHGFFERFIVPNISNKISLNSPVNHIDYSSSEIQVSTDNNKTYKGDRVLVTVPIKILQNNSINFIPALSNEKVQAINSITMGDGIKVFIEFKEKFYPDILGFGGLLSSNDSHEKYFYDAAFRKDSSKNIMGVFTIGNNATPYTSLPNEQAIIDKILTELDEIYDGKASTNYIKHVIQNWSNEPFIQGSYSTDFDGDRTEIMGKIAASINHKVYFAGEALSDQNQATVHGACQTAYDTLRNLLRD